jgi:hypothetical protein
MIKTIAVTISKEILLCDLCCKETRFDSMFYTNPPQYNYICSCGFDVWLKQKYPRDIQQEVIIDE